MDHKRVLGTVGGLIVGMMLGYGWRGSESLPADTPPASVTSKKTRTVHSLPRSSPSPATAADEIVEPTSSGPYERALRVVAEYSGEGVLRCDLSVDLPDGLVSGLNRAHIEGGTLIGAVEEPSGQARIGLPSDPIGAAPRVVVQWWGVWPGDTGHCKVIAPERTTVSGRVVDAQGRAVVGEVGNAVEGTVRTASDGSFVAECWRGADCPLAARSAMGQPWGPFETLVVDAPIDGIELQLNDVPARDLRTFLEDQVAENERLAKQPDPLALALSDPALPDEAKDLVKAWLDEQNESRTVAKSLLADVSRF